MRKEINFAFTISTIMFLILFSCQKQSIKPSKLEVSQFKKIGVLHNAFLTNAKENFVADYSITVLDDKIDYISAFNKNFVNSLPVSSAEKHLYKSELDRTKKYVISNYLMTELLNDVSQRSMQNDTTQNVFDMIEILHNYNVLSDDAVQILTSLLNDVKANYEGNLSDYDLKQKVNDLIKEFNQIGFNKGSEGEMVGAVLAVAQSSIEWWEQNPDAASYGSESRALVLPAWAAADIAGAAVGGVTAAINSYVGNGEINWTSVGSGVLLGAVAGSTGIVGKIAKWLG